MCPPATPPHTPFPHWKRHKSPLLQAQNLQQAVFPFCVSLIRLFPTADGWVCPFYFALNFLFHFFGSPGSQVHLGCSTALTCLASEVPALGALGDTRPMLSKELLSSFISFSRPASFYF